MDTQLNLLDIGLLIILIFTGIRGFTRGFIDEIAGFAGIIIGIYLSSQFYPSLIPHISGFVTSPTWQPITAWGVIFVVVIIITAIVANSLRKLFQLTSTMLINQMLGFAIGMAKGIFVCAIILGILKTVLPDAPFLQNSVVTPYLDVFINFVKQHLPDLEKTQEELMKKLPGGLS
ncbi:CvpA family protein [Desulfovibrio litoralis]|uniref:Membrane protein required for colicin V production n=1 Tax=Desulfovibrio litoralis DSM 11393 TaxID=1121455 RepID=A0A1M7SAN6_9BACT|nr:CvpA family protein [Desulfovibrio litoralis]SHN55637.1 membrane protein required for colicin V production [Desulfovibrio litoralis DSM 11393]